VHQSHLVNKEYISSFSKKEGFNLLFRKWRNYSCFKKQKRGTSEAVGVLIFHFFLTLLNLENLSAKNKFVF